MYSNTVTYFNLCPTVPPQTYVIKIVMLSWWKYKKSFSYFLFVWWNNVRDNIIHLDHTEESMLYY